MSLKVVHFQSDDEKKKSEKERTMDWINNVRPSEPAAQWRLNWRKNNNCAVVLIWTRFARDLTRPDPTRPIIGLLNNPTQANKNFVAF